MYFFLTERKIRNLGPNHLVTSSMADLHQDINIQCFFTYLAGALMEHFHEIIAPLRHWYINPNEKSNK